MNTVDYDQVARFEAADELINILRGILYSLSDSYPEYTNEIESRASELTREKQKLDPKDDNTVKKIRETYKPLVRSYYDNPKDFVLTLDFLEKKVSYE